MWKKTLFIISSSLMIASSFAQPQNDQEALVEALKKSLQILKDNFINLNHTEVVKNVSALGFDNFVQSTNIQTLDGLEE